MAKSITSSTRSNSNAGGVRDNTRRQPSVEYRTFAPFDQKQTRYISFAAGFSDKPTSVRTIRSIPSVVILEFLPSLPSANTERTCSVLRGELGIESESLTSTSEITPVNDPRLLFAASTFSTCSFNSSVVLMFPLASNCFLRLSRRLSNAVDTSSFTSSLRG